MDDNPVSITPLSEEINHEAVFRIENLKPEDKDLNLTFILQKGLLPKNGNIAFDRNLRVDLILNSPFKLNISDITAEHDGMTGQIKSSRIISSSEARNSMRPGNILLRLPKTCRVSWEVS